MKLLDDLIHKTLKPHFEKGGKFEKFYYAFEAAESFHFATDRRTDTGAHIRDPFDLKRMMVTVIIALVPCLLFGIYNTGLQQLTAAGTESPALMDCIIQGGLKVLPLMLVVYATGGTIEAIFAVIRKHEINEGFLVSGMLITLVLPPTLPLWQASIGTAFGIDIVGDGELPLHYEAEVVEVINEVFQRLDLGAFTIKINNRKLLEGLYRQAGIEDMNSTLIAVDKIDKPDVGKDGVIELLRQNGLNQQQAEFCTDIASRKYSIKEAFGFLQSLKVDTPMLEAARFELESIFKNLEHLPEDSLLFDLSIARGLDYYTGSVYECHLKGLEKFGSVCSGGRYDNLAGKFTKRQLPGVGLSIGVTRLLYVLFENGRLNLCKPTPSRRLQ